MSLRIRRKLEDKIVILASKSPRRKELLRLLCEDFEIFPSNSEEIIPDNVQPHYVAEFLASAKCREVVESKSADLVIGCDTIVLLGDKILGKPKNHQEAREMLSILSGKTHEVVSGTAFYCGGKMHSFSELTKVTFRNLTENDVEEYLNTGEPFDKAGAYGIQGYGSLLVKKIEGDYFNVVGLPVSTLAMLLDKFF